MDGSPALDSAHVYSISSTRGDIELRLRELESGPSASALLSMQITKSFWDRRHPIAEADWVEDATLLFHQVGVTSDWKERLLAGLHAWEADRRPFELNLAVDAQSLWFRLSASHRDVIVTHGKAVFEVRYSDGFVQSSVLTVVDQSCAA